jgi:hypothetical protein
MKRGIAVLTGMQASTQGELLDTLCDAYTPSELLSIYGELHRNAASLHARDLKQIMFSLRDIRAQEYGGEVVPACFSLLGFAALNSKHFSAGLRVSAAQEIRTAMGEHSHRQSVQERLPTPYPSPRNATVG